MSASSALLYGYLRNNVIVDGTFRAQKAATFDTSVTAVTLSATTQSATTSTVLGQSTTGTLNVTSSTNTKDPSTGLLTAAAATISGGCIVNQDQYVKGTATSNASTVATTLTAADINATNSATTKTLTASGVTTLSGNVNIGTNCLVTSSSTQDISTTNNVTTAAISTLGSIFANKNIKATNAVSSATMSATTSITAPAVNATSSLNVTGPTTLTGSGSISGAFASSSTSDIVAPTSSGGSYSAAIATQGSVFAAKQILALGNITTNSALSASSITSTNDVNSSTLNVSGVASFNSPTDVAISASNVATAGVVCQGGLYAVKKISAASVLSALSVTDYNPTAPTATSFYCAGGGYVTKALGLGPTTLWLSSAITAAGSSQTGSTSNSTIFRVRSSDTTNTAIRLSVANASMGNNYYDSSLVLWGLGADTTSTNYERMILGVNSAGGYLNYLFGGTGSVKPLNIMNGATFTTGGTLQLNTALNLNGVTRVATPTSAYTLTEPTALPPVSGMMLSATTSGVQSWTYPTSIFTGDGSTAAPTQLSAIPKLYILTQTLTGNTGQMAFYLTNNGQSGGTPLGTFLGIHFAARLSSQSNTATNGPIASEAYRGTNGVVANVLVSKSTTIVVGGTATGLQAAPSGTIVTCFAWIY